MFVYVNKMMMMMISVDWNHLPLSMKQKKPSPDSLSQGLQSYFQDVHVIPAVRGAPISWCLLSVAKF